MEPLEHEQPDDEDERQRPRPLRPFVGQQVEFEPEHEGQPVRERDEDRVRQDDHRSPQAEDPLEGRHDGYTSHRPRMVIHTERRIRARS